jgi:hypothetical protein
MFFVICIGIAAALLFYLLRSNEEQVANEAIREIRDLCRKVENNAAAQRGLTEARAAELAEGLKRIECSMVEHQACLYTIAKEKEYATVPSSDSVPETPST